MDPEYATALTAFLDNAPKSPGPPTIEQTRAFFVKTVTTPASDYHAERLPAASTYTVQDKSIPVDGAEITVRYVVPVRNGGEDTFPIFFYIHGGGCVGDIDLDDFHLRRLSVDLRIVVVNTRYRLAPENPFPTGLNDCYTALKWVAENASSLGADPSKGFLVGGHSAGAYLSAVLTHEARDDPFFTGKQITGQLLREPWVAHPDTYPDEYKDELRSMEDNKNNPSLSRAVLFHLFDMYGGSPSDPRFAPLLYPSHEGLPPAYIQVMSLDALRDDGVVYEKALRKAGVKTKIDMYSGVNHGFHYTFPAIRVAVKVREDITNGLKWLLGRYA